MEISEIFHVLLGGLLGSAPSLVVWIAVIVVAIVILRRRGGRAERFLVAGASLGIVGSLLYIPAVLFVPLLITEGRTIEYATGFVAVYDVIRDIVSAAGLICFIYAFWVKFKTSEVTGTALHGKFNDGEEEQRAD